MIAELPAALAEGTPLRAWVTPGSPCASVYIPASRAAVSPARPLARSSSRAELWRAADAVRRRVEEAGEPLVGGPRHAVDPVREQLWAEADTIAQADQIGRPGGCLGRPDAGRTARLYPLIA